MGRLFDASLGGDLRLLVQTDFKTIQSDVDADPAVVAAQNKLTTDSATVTADQKVLQTALTKLQTDIRNHA